ncbi:phosphoribosyltransferase-like protein [Massilia varians]
MSRRNDLLASISNTIHSYRAGQIAAPTPQHVDRWVSQFNPADQLPILEALDPFMQRTYFTQQEVEDFLKLVVLTPKIGGANPSAFWRSANFLRIQQNGNSQNEMLDLLSQQLLLTYGFSVDECGSDVGPYIYLDDVMCTGNRITTDLETWIMNDAPDNAELYVILLISHTGTGYYMKNTRIPDILKRAGKTIVVKYRYRFNVENTKYNKNKSEVFWPVTLPADDATQNYANQGRYPFLPRVPVAHESRVFATEAGRQVLENAFFEAGMRIRSHQANPSAILKPMGYGGFSLGFGCVFTTFRNCPNNTPLALWWGNGDADGPLQWYPLLPRNTYNN